MNYIQFLLDAWGNDVLRWHENNHYSANTTISKCMEMGAIGAAIRIGLPDNYYFPNRVFRKITTIVKELPDNDINLIDIKYIKKLRNVEIAKTIGCHVNSVSQKLERVEKKVQIALDKL